MPVRYHELMNPPVTLLLTGPVLSTLLRLSLPNVLAMSMAVLVGIAETWYVGKLGNRPGASNPYFQKHEVKNGLT
jgi:Na+-driven multidrug efflux pump